MMKTAMQSSLSKAGVTRKETKTTACVELTLLGVARESGPRHPAQLLGMRGGVGAVGKGP